MGAGPIRSKMLAFYPLLYHGCIVTPYIVALDASVHHAGVMAGVHVMLLNDSKITHTHGSAVSATLLFTT